jgi:hypothetical protein
MQTANINFDNSLSPAHTLLQIICAYQKGLVYDILRTLKDCNVQVLGDNMHGFEQILALHFFFFSRNNIALETFRREMIMTVLHACIIHHNTYYVIRMILSHHVPCSVRCFMGGSGQIRMGQSTKVYERLIFL